VVRERGPEHGEVRNAELAVAAKDLLVCSLQVKIRDNVLIPVGEVDTGSGKMDRSESTLEKSRRVNVNGRPRDQNMPALN
jgi:hypothetical protein